MRSLLPQLLQQAHRPPAHREEQQQTLRLGATREGKLLALIYKQPSTTSPWGDYAEANSRMSNMAV